MGFNNHPNRRSVNAAFFRAFLDHLLQDPNAGYTSESLLEVLRETALDEAFFRLTSRRALSVEFQPTPFQHRGLSFGATESTIFVHDYRGNALGLSDEDQKVVRQELIRLTRGFPHNVPKLWTFLP